MDDRTPWQPSRPYVAMVWATAALLGLLGGLGLGLLLQSVGGGIVAGVLIALLVGLAGTLAARRGGGDTVEGAPPYSGHPGDRGSGGF